ncbi:MAG: hypothetical protein MJ113_02255 [Lachnospiraceae bacterium]|nr:hypothetical protein [Lachnospiraceae bacterium]
MDKHRRISFFSSSKGKCSVSANMCLLATYLSTIKEKKVLVISLNSDDSCFDELYFGTGEAGKNCALLNNIGLIGLKRICEIRSIDSELVEKYAVKINKLLYILPGYEKDMQNQFIDSVLKAADEVYEYILIDFSGYENNDKFESLFSFVCISQEENVIKNGLDIFNTGDRRKKAFIVGRYDSKSVYNVSNIRKIMKSLIKENKEKSKGEELKSEICAEHIFPISYETSIFDYISSCNTEGLSKHFLLINSEKKKKSKVLSELEALTDYMEEE